MLGYLGGIYRGFLTLADTCHYWARLGWLAGGVWAVKIPLAVWPKTGLVGGLGKRCF